jgi:hypothetical protein
VSGDPKTNKKHSQRKWLKEALGEKTRNPTQGCVYDAKRNVSTFSPKGQFFEENSGPTKLPTKLGVTQVSGTSKSSISISTLECQQ